MPQLNLTFLQTIPPYVIAIVLFLLTIACYMIGHRLRVRKLSKSKNPGEDDPSAVSGTLLGLLALLLAFTFGMANSRYDDRRSLVTKEANAISTAILRADIFPDSMRTILRTHFRDYLEARINHYEAKMDISKTVAEYNRANEISSEIWAITATYAQKDNITVRTSELIPALNDMIDITTIRRAVGESTIPDSIMYFLFILCVCATFLLGYDRKSSFDWIIVIGFAIMLSATVYTILDLDRPRSGLITLDKANMKIIELRELLK
jgi:hypothetical protein